MSYGLNFAEWFRNALAQRGITAGQFAKTAGISRSAAYFYLSGDRLPTFDVAAKIARALGFAQSDLPSFKYGKPGRPRSSSFKLPSLVSKTRIRNDEASLGSTDLIVAR